MTQRFLHSLTSVPKRALSQVFFASFVLIVLSGAMVILPSTQATADDASQASVPESAAGEQWVLLFDGQSLDGWEKVGKKDSVWEVVDGSLVGSGTQSMLVCTAKTYKNFRYRIEAKINDGGNSGMYFRTTRKPSFREGYEAQIDSTHKDPIRTGSLYGFCHVYQQLVKPNSWFTYEVEVKDGVWRGREMTQIKITVDGNELYEYMDFDKTWPAGYFGFQQHDPGSKVHIRKVEVLPLAD
ncbi:protein of unknown function [Neorhodopirellula lusitana]|uniref:3-keto-alpha-glucoside-1,2-lyase/3-keto-2-hydroxy-glucal hydratase domain-containing protein n=2 Tax=Neorhodopirellula lusitana TaxID=445327 RepID=A0ABY1QFS6_9BACT|nr:protein of unknown function [Neorhodopirellula lusitana]